MSVCSLLDLDSGASGLDKWMYYKCQCTSFVAWRINKKLRTKFHGRYLGQQWGSANEWDEAGRHRKSKGVTVNKTPKVNSVAQWNNKYGHVA